MAEHFHSIYQLMANQSNLHPVWTQNHTLRKKQKEHNDIFVETFFWSTICRIHIRKTKFSCKTHKHVVWRSKSKERKFNSIRSPWGTRISHSQSKLFAYVSGCWGDENWPFGAVNRPPQPGIPETTKKSKVTYYEKCWNFFLSSSFDKSSTTANDNCILTCKVWYSLICHINWKIL